MRRPTIAFLARGIEGIYVRMTAKAPTEEEARTLLDAEDRELIAPESRMMLEGVIRMADMTAGDVMVAAPRSFSMYFCVSSRRFSSAILSLMSWRASSNVFTFVSVRDSS